MTGLGELKAYPDSDALLIQTWIAEAPLHAWRSANSLLEDGDNPVTTETLRQALRNDLAGSCYIASTLARNGHQATLREALARALEAADGPDAVQPDLEVAASVLRDYGTSQQFKQLATFVRKYQIADQKFSKARLGSQDVPNWCLRPFTNNPELFPPPHQPHTLQTRFPHSTHSVI